MPPRIPNQSTPSAAVLSLLKNAISNNTRPELAWQPCRHQQQTTAAFSTTPNRLGFSKARKLFRAWLAGSGKQYRFHRPGETNYIQMKGQLNINTTRPFPHNALFRSTPVLSERSRELVWEKVMRKGETVKAVSAELNIDIQRVAAIVRLKEVEKDWQAKGKKLAKTYSETILSMLPVADVQDNRRHADYAFEPINEVHVHPFTMQQIFWPTSESRHFTREDAAKAFHEKMLSSDERVPHPELIQMEREVLQGRPLWDATERFKQNAMESERKAAEKQLAKTAVEAKYTTRVNSNRFQFRFRQINSEEIGPTGRARHAVGSKYGVPHYDRAKGQVKIPTSVP
ncbi:eukaryotic mitochondrial regulator protein-domain-containing protein [Xylariomycetidae sp. FL2044]|nr:eukaryotic mitochondrial regulator protein-domain-containing protein [Xylariomycetidae sp. FL2044]